VPSRVVRGPLPTSDTDCWAASHRPLQAPKGLLGEGLAGTPRLAVGVASSPVTRLSPLHIVVGRDTPPPCGSVDGDNADALAATTSGLFALDARGLARLTGRRGPALFPPRRPSRAAVPRQ